jgi:hypothetical protein
VVLLGNELFLGVDACHNVQPWLDLIASRTASLKPAREVGWGPARKAWKTLLFLQRHAQVCGFISVVWGGRRLPKRHLFFASLTSASWNCLLTFFCACQAGEERPTAVGMEIRDLNLEDPWMKTFGMIMEVWS